MKLLLDEHLSPQVARTLRERGHDIEAVAERPDLRRRADRDILTFAATERRVLVTEDIRDYVVLGSRRLPNRRPHHGIALLPRPSFPLSRGAMGSVIRALEALLASHPGDDELVGQVVWVEPAANEPALG